jgi:predicted esterase
MKTSWRTAAAIGLSAALFVLAGLVRAQERGVAQAGPPQPATGRGAAQAGRGFVNMDPVDERVQLRSYLFTDTDETLPYAVFVPSKYSKDKKTPVVLALHGMNGSHRTFMRTACVDEAEKNGFILVGPMGYNSTGSFGMQFAGRGGPGGPGRGRADAPRPADATPPPPTPGTGAGREGLAAPPRPGADAVREGRGGRAGARGPFMGMKEPGGTKETDRAKVAELSEKDTMNVLAIIRKEFNVDENRIYLMGHSLGGGGALHMGEKYSTLWAGVAGLAPAAFGFQWAPDSKLKDVPLLIIQGDADALVQPARTQQLVEEIKGLNYRVEYKLLPGLDHGSIIGGSMPDVFQFFAAHTRGKSK